MTKARDPKKRVWRTTTRKGERVLIDPDGNIWRGTAQEVRDAPLMPRRRNALAQGIKIARHIAAQFDYTPEQAAEYVREKRRDAIRAGYRDTRDASVNISPELYLQLTAGARLVMGAGKTPDDFFARLFRDELEALLDVAENETGKREIPMTRHERAALERLRGTPGT